MISGKSNVEFTTEKDGEGNEGEEEGGEGLKKDE